MAKSDTVGLVPGKIRLVYLFAFVGAIILGSFALRWHVVEAAKFTNLAEARSRSEAIPALRGTIYANDGSTLAYSQPRYNLYIYYRDLQFAEEKGLQTREEFVDGVAPIIDTTPERLNKLLEEKIDAGIYWFRIAEAITISEGERIQNLTREKDKDLDVDERGKLQGYTLIPTYKRIYPENKLAAQVLGLTKINEDNFEVETVGQSGLEGEWNGILEPLEGYVGGEVDALGNVLGLASEETIEAKRGSDIYTSIDKRIQREIEYQLAKGVRDYEAASGSIIVMEPRTGAILAMANYPTYNPNSRSQENSDAYGLKAVSEPYEVGSVGKTFTLAAAIDVGAAKPSDVLLPNGHEGCMFLIEGLADVCTADKKPQPAMPLNEAYRLSDNLYFIALAEKMKKRDMYEYLSKFGIGRVTGVDVSGESIGYLKDWQDWNRADVAAYSYGHSYQANLLQVTAGYAALANYGVRMQPHFVTKVVEADGTEKIYEPTAIERAVSKKTVLKMDSMMNEVFLSNVPYWDQDLTQYRIALKSGTALIPYRDRAGYSSEVNTTYIGYDASPDRKFVLAIRLDSPQIGDLSSENTRYVWMNTFRAIKDIIGVRKQGEF